MNDRQYIMFIAVVLLLCVLANNAKEAPIRCELPPIAEVQGE